MKRNDGSQRSSIFERWMRIVHVLSHQLRNGPNLLDPLMLTQSTSAPQRCIWPLRLLIPFLLRRVDRLVEDVFFLEDALPTAT